MKKLILSALIGVTLASSVVPTYAFPGKKKIKNSCEVSIVEDDKPKIEESIEVNEESPNDDDPLIAI